MSGHDAIMDERMGMDESGVMDETEGRGDHGTVGVPVAAPNAETRDFRAIVAALDTIYTSGSDVASLVEAGKLERGAISRERLERWLVTSSIERVGTAAATLASMGLDLPDELMLDELVRGRDLVAVPEDDIAWDAVEEVAFTVLPAVRAYAKPLYWDRWQEVLGEGAPRLPFA